MAGEIYFGNGSYQTWIPAPLSGMGASAVGWSSMNQYLNGRASVRRSMASHREFNASWNGPQTDTSLSKSLQEIKDFAEGYYGTGPFYFVDPYAVTTNVLPPHWAVPALTENDWPELTSDLMPEFISSAVTTNNFPKSAVRYVTTGAYSSTRKLTLIIPTGYKLAFGWHGTAASATSGIRIVPYLRSTGAADTAINPAKIVAGGTLRTNTTVSGTTYSKVEIFFATSGAATVELVGMMAQIIPTASSVPAGAFIEGRGTTGVEFANHPEIEYYSANINGGWIGMSAKWIEV
jgi:hypothetical protein